MEKIVLSCENLNENHKFPKCRPECVTSLNDIRLTIPTDVNLQHTVWSTNLLIEPILECGRRLFDLELGKSDESQGSLRSSTNNCSNTSDTTNKLSKVVVEGHSNAWVMCIANLIAGNSKVRTLFWSRFGSSSINEVLLESSSLVAQKWCLVLQNCLLEKTICNDYLETSQELSTIVKRLCELHLIESNAQCFPLYCLELVISCDDNHTRLEECWQTLTYEQKSLFANVIGTILRDEHNTPVKSKNSLPKLVCSLFKKETSQVLHAQSDDLNAEVLLGVCDALLAAAVHDDHRPVLQQDLTLLPCVLEFLKLMNHATYSKEGGTSAVRWCREHLCLNDSAAKCFRSDMVHILGNLAYRSPPNQEQLRLHGGLEEIFSSCRRDSNNPLMHEAVAFALSFSLRDNVANREHLQKLLSSAEQNILMEKLGIKIH